jgi:TatA/E family protein of Tat protein translocase
MGLDNPLHIAFLVVILLLVFGARRLPEIGRSLGSGMREFKDSITGDSKPTLHSGAAGEQQAVPPAGAVAQAPAPPPAADAPASAPAPAAAPPPAAAPAADAPAPPPAAPAPAEPQRQA